MSKMQITISTKLVEYAGTETCRVGQIYGGGRCGKRAEVITVIAGSNGYRYESRPRCLADAKELIREP